MSRDWTEERIPGVWVCFGDESDVAVVALPDDSDLIARLATRFAIDGDPPVSFRRTSAVLTFESQTSEMLLLARHSGAQRRSPT